MNSRRNSRSSEEPLTRSSSIDYERHCGLLTPRSEGSLSPSPPDQQASEPPKYIVLGLWPHARQDQVDYYVRGYTSMYPTARIIPLYHSRATTQNVEDVLQILLEDVEKFTGHVHADTLIHLFGDDAAQNVCLLLKAYRIRTDQPLGVKAIILDTVPTVGAPTWYTLRSRPHQLFVFLYLTILALFQYIVSALTLWTSKRARQDLYDPTLLCHEARKCYIFAEKDIMFTWDRPRANDEICERREFDIRRASIDREERWTGDQERYWMGIENAWDGQHV